MAVKGLARVWRGHVACGGGVIVRVEWTVHGTWERVILGMERVIVGIDTKDYKKQQTFRSFPGCL